MNDPAPITARTNLLAHLVHGLLDDLGLTSQDIWLRGLLTESNTEVEFADALASQIDLTEDAIYRVWHQYIAFGLDDANIQFDHELDTVEAL